MTKDDKRTIWVTARRHGRLSRLKIVYPQWVTDRAERPVYDVAMARELLGLTGEFPGSKRALYVLLAEYRHALHAMALQVDALHALTQHAEARQRAGQRPELSPDQPARAHPASFRAGGHAQTRRPPSHPPPGAGRITTTTGQHPHSTRTVADWLACGACAPLAGRCLAACLPECGCEHCMREIIIAPPPSGCYS